jgi:aminopeptidase N
MKIQSSLLPAFLLCITTLLQAQESKIKIQGAGGKLNPLQANMDIRHYTLSLDINIPNQSIEGYTEISLILAHKTDTLLFNFINVLTVNNIIVDNKKQQFSHPGDSIFIINNQAFNEGKHTIKIFYGGKPPVAARPPWEGGFTWTKDKSGNPWVVVNCQLQGAKVFFPCKDHPSDEANEGADLFITIPQGLSVAGPGLLQSVKRQKNHKATWHWKTNYTISNYCIVFDIGKYKVVQKEYTTIDGNKVPMQFYVLEEDTAYAAHALEIKERDTKVLEKYFGEYPWIKEKIGLAEVPNPGMEHQTMITYGDHFKYKKIGGQDYSDNLFHEYAHEWWANKITNKDWAYMWIQEGIATYAEALCVKELGGENAYDSFMLGQRRNIRNKRPIVPDEGMNMDNINWDIYPKGAFLMHTLRYILGDSIFFPALKKFVTDVKYPYNQFFISDDVEHFFSAQSGKDLKPLFYFYLKTNETINIDLVKYAPDKYFVVVENAPIHSLPIDILTDSGIIHSTMEGVTNQQFRITSKTQPVIDPRNWYFKKVILQ